MRFLRKNKSDRTIIVVSDLHLGAGPMIGGIRNYLEDFNSDQELVELLDYYSSGEYQNKKVEIIINGDFLDFLAVPFIEFFDDEFWSEEAALAKFDLILKAHPEVINGLCLFVKKPEKKLTYIIGNHDAELILPKMQEKFLNLFDKEHRDSVEIIHEPQNAYRPHPEVLLKHGHEYEIAHLYNTEESIVKNENGRRYFIPPWGSYYVTRVLNKFKEERHHVDSVKPIKKFIINGIIYDTLFTIRFLLATTYYFIMVRAILIFKEKKGFKKFLKKSFEELELFNDYEELTQDVFIENPEVNILIVGHTHEPMLRSNSEGKVFINTGTWTHMHHLDFGKNSDGENLTYAQVDIDGAGKIVSTNLFCWRGRSNLPFYDFS